MNLNLPIDIPKKLQMISLEGIDGSGKTTQVKKIKGELKKRGILSVTASNPRHDDLGNFIRNNIKNLNKWTKHTLFILDIISTLKKHEEKHKNKILIWDRYKHSGIVSNKDTTPQEAKLWYQSIPDPKLIFFLDISPSQIVKNRQLHDHSKDEKWQKMKYKRYKKIFKNISNVTTIDGNLPTKQVTEIIVANILKHYETTHAKRHR